MQTPFLIFRGPSALYRARHNAVNNIPLSEQIDQNQRRGNNQQGCRRQRPVIGILPLEDKHTPCDVVVGLGSQINRGAYDVVPDPDHGKHSHRNNSGLGERDHDGDDVPQIAAPVYDRCLIQILGETPEVSCKEEYGCGVYPCHNQHIADSRVVQARPQD